ncbi:MAG: hypothetical protein PHI72_08610 [Atribacterota bacterium]|jgi:hypothetical protein|nr:hypothetical protein [Atribacterota bacterium]MDD4895555.1 hypothetical protein [Atribacterota bacterium]MDD5636496.1 hypothetical protein [Atribacterota bacterium]
MAFQLIVLSLLSSFPFLYTLQPTVIFGPVILTSKVDYQKIGGHQSVKNRVAEDLDISKICLKERIKI